MKKMKFVQPIRDKKKIALMKTLLKEKDEKYYIMFVIGINVGLRISDILKLKVSDVYNKTHINISEQKTHKAKRFLINSQMQKEFQNYIESNNLKDDDYLIQSRKGQNKPLQRNRAYVVLNEIASQIGLEEIGTHSLRKTFGYWHYQQFKDVALLQNIFSHSSQSVTLRYIGLEQDQLDNSISDFFL